MSDTPILDTIEGVVGQGPILRRIREVIYRVRGRIREIRERFRQRR